MEITLDLALAERIAGHLLDVLSSDEGVLLLDETSSSQQAERDLAELYAAILEAYSSG